MDTITETAKAIIRNTAKQQAETDLVIDAQEQTKKAATKIKALHEVERAIPDGKQPKVVEEENAENEIEVEVEVENEIEVGMAIKTIEQVNQIGQRELDVGVEIRNRIVRRRFEKVRGRCALRSIRLAWQEHEE